MIVQIDPSSPVPPYEQVRREIESRIVGETLRPGTKLPTIRQLANELGLATNTVARAYRELETAGLVVTRSRSGTIVSHHPPAPAATQTRDRVREAARQYLSFTQSLGLSKEDAIAALQHLPPQQ